MINFKGFFYFKIFMYICIMLRYKKGDIVICVTNKMYGMKYLLDKMYGMKYLLEVGEQYQIDDCIEIGGNVFLPAELKWLIKKVGNVFGSEKNLVSVSNVKTGEDIGVFDDRHFMPMDVWREFQLRKILE